MKKILSLLIAFLLVVPIVSIPTTSAAPAIDNYASKLTAELKNKVKAMSDDDSVTIYLWLQSPDFSNINAEIAEIIDKDAKNQTDAYLKAKKEIYAEKITTKSTEILDSFEIPTADRIFISKYDPYCIVNITPAKLREVVELEEFRYAGLYKESKAGEGIYDLDNPIKTYITEKDGLRLTAYLKTSIYNTKDTVRLYYTLENTNDSSVYGWSPDGAYMHDFAYFNSESAPNEKYYEIYTTIDSERTFEIESGKAIKGECNFPLPELKVSEGEYTISLNIKYSKDDIIDDGWNNAENHYKELSLKCDFTVNNDMIDVAPRKAFIKQQDGITITALLRDDKAEAKDYFQFDFYFENNTGKTMYFFRESEFELFYYDCISKDGKYFGGSNTPTGGMQPAYTVFEIKDGETKKEKGAVWAEFIQSWEEGISDEVVPAGEYDTNVWVDYSFDKIEDSVNLSALHSRDWDRIDLSFPVYVIEDNLNSKTFTKEEKGVKLVVEVSESEVNQREPFYITVSITNNSGKSVYFSRKTITDPFYYADVTFPSGKIIDIEKVYKSQPANPTKWIITKGGTYTQKLKMLPAYISNGEDSYICPNLSQDYARADKKIADTPAGVYEGLAEFKYSFTQGLKPDELDESISLDFDVTVVEKESADEEPEEEEEIPEPVDSVGRIYIKEQGDLELTVTLNKDEYVSGEDIYVTATLKNNGTEDIYYRRNNIEANDDIYTSIKNADGEKFIDTDYYGMSPMVQDKVLKAGEEITQKMRFKSGIRADDGFGKFNEQTGLWKPAAPGTYQGNCLFPYAFEEGDNTEELSMDFDVVINRYFDYTGKTIVKEKDNLKLTVTLDKLEYVEGEDIHITATLKNNGTEDIHYRRNSHYEKNKFDISIKDAEGKKFIDADGESIALDVISDYVLESGEEITQEQTFKQELRGTGDSRETAPIGTYDGNCTFNYAHEEGENTDLLDVDFGVVIKEDTSKTFETEQDGVKLTATVYNDKGKAGDEFFYDVSLENNSGKTMHFFREGGEGIIFVDIESEDGRYFAGSRHAEEPMPSIWFRELADGEKKEFKNAKFTAVFKDGTFNDYSQDPVPAGEYNLHIYVEFDFDELDEDLWSNPSKAKDMDWDLIELNIPIYIEGDEEPEKEEYDLYISSATTAETNLVDGESTALSTVVRNMSDEDIEKEITVEFYMNGKLFDTVTEVKEIEAGKYAVITSNEEKELYFGTHTISTEVKISDDTAIDNDTSNNRVKTRIKVLDE